MVERIVADPALDEFARPIDGFESDVVLKSHVDGRRQAQVNFKLTGAR
jgi:hypothetical protein